MNIETVVVGPLQTNCYILSIDDYVLVIDPGDEIDKITKTIKNRNVVGCIITHYHFDHIGCLNYFSKIYDINNLQEGKQSIGPFHFEVIYTPGHKEDCITIYFAKEQIMFVGDFLFKDGMGRCDLEGGSIDDMKASLRKISYYDEKITIYPGHGESTKLGLEIDKY